MPRGPAALLEASERTRLAIAEHGLALFARDGFDAVTTQQIAEAAGYTQRTLFRYFERKDAILFSGGFDYLERLRVVLSAVIDEGLGGYDATRAAFLRLAEAYDTNRAVVSRIHAIIAGSPYLQAIETVRQHRADRLVACALEGGAAWDGTAEPGLAARTAAAILMSMHRPVIRAWLRGELTGPMTRYAGIAWEETYRQFPHALAYARSIAERFTG